LGSALRERRGQLGLSLDEISVATRIPVEHLEAIEKERPQDLPPGPYAAAYARLLTQHLDLKLPEEAVTEAVVEEVPFERAPPPAAPLWLVRLLAGGSALALILLVLVQGWQRFVPEPEPVVVVPDQFVVVTARRSGRVKAVVDGEVVHDDVLAGGQSLELEGHQRVEVEVPSTSRFRFQWNGETVVPQGLQDHPRRLVFVDDVGPLPPDEEAE
jgi:transcriptional regulator with XRE-family HTH domain